MECQALQHFLKSASWLAEDEKKLDEQHVSDAPLVAHLSSCSVCQKSLGHLSEEIFAADALTCDECCLLLPRYYEEMNPPEDNLRESLLSISDAIEVTIHLYSCASCRTSYRVLAKLWNDDFL